MTAPSFPSTARLGVAMIGYAFMGKAHSNAWRNVASFFDVAAFEQKLLVGGDIAGVAGAAQKYGWAETATDWRAVLVRADIDIVDICAPGVDARRDRHRGTCCGQAVLVAKPLANTLAEAARAARAKGVQSMIGFNYRRAAALALAKELIAEGRLGTVRHVRAS